MALVIVAAAMVALRMAAVPAASNWFWGVDLGRYLPLPVALLALAVAAAGFVPPVARGIVAGLERVGLAWERAGRWADLLIGLAVGLALFALRDSLRFTGDFDLRVSAIDYPKPPAQLFPQAFPLDVAANFLVPRLLLARGLTPALALQAVGATLGGAFAVASFSFLRAAGARGAALPAAAVAILAAGYLQHFAGYDKFGPLLVGVAVAAAGAVRIERTGRGVWTLVSGAAICVLAHRSGYLLLPAAFWMVARALRRAEGRRAGVWWAGAALLATALLPLPAALDIFLRLDWSIHLPGGRVARSLESADAPALLVRFSDFVNALLFTAPLWPLGLVAGWGLPGRRAPAARRPPRLGRMAALAFGAQAIALFEVGRGSGRDWDVVAAFGALAALASAAALIPAWRTRGRLPLAAPCVSLSLAVAILTWAPHVSEEVGMRRIRGLLEARPRWSDAARAQALDFLGLRALMAGRNQEAAADFEHAIVAAPNPRFFQELGLARLGSGRLGAARAAFLRSASLAPGVADPWAALARLALEERDTLGAIAYADSALRRNPSHAEAGTLRQQLERAHGR